MCSSSKLNIAIVGSGLIGPRHAQSILSNPYTNLHSIIDPAPHAPALAASLNTTHYPSTTALLSSFSKPEAAIICIPNSTHVPIALELIAAGIHVLVEKPVATNIEDGKRLIKAAAEKGVKVLVGHHRRFNPYLLAAKKALDEESLGQVIAVQGVWCLKKDSGYFDGIGEWRRGEETGGTVMINLVHEVDLLQYLLGPIVFVSALPTTKTRGFEAEEGAAILLRFESGVVGTFVLGDNTPSPWNFEAGTGENPNIPHVKAEDGAGGFYRIMGSEGSLSAPDLTRWDGNWNEKLSREELPVDKKKVPFDSQVQHLVEVVRDGKSPNCTAEEGLRAIVICEAVKRSMRDGGESIEIRGLDIMERQKTP